MLDSVFDLFVQCRTLHRAAGGLGVGLTLARSLVAMHGGTIQVHSDGEGTGSEFLVQLPLAPAIVTEASEPGRARLRTRLPKGAKIASLSPSKGDGQLNWVLRPWTRYVNESGQPIWLTNASALLGVNGAVFQGLINPIVPGSGFLYVTGMKADYTVLPSVRNCNDWTSATASGSWAASAQAPTASFSNKRGIITIRARPGARPFICTASSSELSGASARQAPANDELSRSL